MAARDWRIAQALVSYTSLCRILNTLTKEEVMHCLEVEARTQRRRSVTNRLIMRVVSLQSKELNRQLKERFHASS